MARGPKFKCSVDSLGHLGPTEDKSELLKVIGSPRLKRAYKASEAASDSDPDPDESLETSMVVLVIEGHVLSQALDQIAVKQVQQKMSLLTRFPYLQNYTRITLIKLINALRKIDLTRGTTLFTQGEPFTHFYLLICGEFDQFWVKQKGKSGQQSKNKYRINQMSEALEDNSVAILSSFQTLGLEEWISGSDTYMTTVKCKSAAGEIEDHNLYELLLNFYGKGLLDQTSSFGNN